MNVYERLNKLIAYMSEKSFPATIPNLANAVGVYEEQIQQDIQYLLNYEMPKGNPLFAPHIKVSEIEGKPCYHIAKQTFFPQSREGQISYLPFPDDARLFPLSFGESTFFESAKKLDFNLEEVFEDSSLCDTSTIEDWTISSSTDYRNNIFSCIPPVFHSDLLNDENMLLLQKAIQLGATITIDHKRITPQYIKYDINTGGCYILEIDEDDHYIEAFSIDEIEYFEFDGYTNGSMGTIDEAIMLNKHYADNISIHPEILRRIHCIWSFEYDNSADIFEQEPTHIKLKVFREENGLVDVIHKIRKHRPYSTFTGPFSGILASGDTETFYYYEDDILGIHSFKHWIQQFGSSIVVLEPKELAHEIYRELISSL